jgi:predicted phosphodiesterase
VEGFVVGGDEAPVLFNSEDQLSSTDYTNLIEAAYRQIFFHAFQWDREPVLESQVRNGQITVRDFIRGLPWAISETIAGVRLTVMHCALAADGRSLKDVSPRWDDAGILDLFTDTPGDLVCFGHLHERRFNREYHGRHFLNPGAAGCSRRPEATYAIIEMADGHFAIEERGVTYEREALLARYDALEIPARDFIRKVFFGV